MLIDEFVVKLLLERALDLVALSGYRDGLDGRGGGVVLDAPLDLIVVDVVCERWRPLARSLQRKDWLACWMTYGGPRPGLTIARASARTSWPPHSQEEQQLRKTEELLEGGN